MHTAEANGKPTYTSINRERPKVLPFPMWRLVLDAHRRKRAGHVGHTLPDNAEGRTCLAIYLGIGMRVANVDAPWLTPQELPAIRRAAKPFKMLRIRKSFYELRAAIGKAINLTWADLEKHGYRIKDGKRVKTGIWMFPPCDDPTPEQRQRRYEEQWQRSEAVIRRQREKRRQQHAALIAQCDDTRQAAVATAVFNGRGRKVSVRTIMRSITRAGTRMLFPPTDASFDRIVRRILDRLEQRGMIETQATGGRRMRIATLCPSWHGGCTLAAPNDPDSKRGVDLSGSSNEKTLHDQQLDADFADFERGGGAKKEGASITLTETCAGGNTVKKKRGLPLAETADPSQPISGSSARSERGTQHLDGEGPHPRQEPASPSAPAPVGRATGNDQEGLTAGDDLAATEVSLVALPSLLLPHLHRPGFGHVRGAPRWTLPGTDRAAMNSPSSAASFHKQDAALDEVEVAAKGTDATTNGEDTMRRLTREEREAAKLEVAYLRQRMAALERLLLGDDDDRPDDGIEPSHRTVQ